jgi:hypothetical protein
VEKLAHGWHIPNWPAYLTLGFLLQVIVRVIMSMLSAVIATARGRRRRRGLYRQPRQRLHSRFWIYFWRSFKGCHPPDRDDVRSKSDYLFPAILGLLELYSYPVLMATDAWTVIGAWMGFKTVAQWKSWGDDRVTFNHYLIGNAIVVLLSLLCLVPFVQTR